jgi:hypothetical protein
MKRKRKEIDPIQLLAGLLQVQVSCLVEAAVRVLEPETAEKEYRMQAEFCQGLAKSCEAKARLAEKLIAEPGAEEPEGYP